MRHITDPSGVAALRALIGQPYNAVYTLDTRFDWQDAYSIVNAAGRLTGELVDDITPSKSYVIVTIRDGRVVDIGGPDASDAAVWYNTAITLGWRPESDY